MSWVTIDRNKCTDCRICVQDCPRCFRIEGNEIIVNAGEMSCALCGHCVSLCKTGAISHQKMNMDNFLGVKGDIIRTDDFIQFIRERRAHRHFKNQKIGDADLKKLVDSVRYAPTGGNSQRVELILLNKPERIKQLSGLAVDYIASGVNELTNRLKELKSDKNASAAEIQQTEGMLRFREMLVKARDAGNDPVFYNAPAVAVFHSTPQTVTPKDDCVIASTTMGLLARTMGLETTYIFLFENAVNNYKPLRDELKLPAGNIVYSVIVIGYGKFEYLRTVDRKPMRVRWE